MYITLSAVSVSFKVEPQLKNIVMKLTSESTFVRVFPFSINDLERDVLVGWTSMES